MKKLIKKTPLISIVLVIFAFISLVWANQQKGMSTDAAKIDEIVFLENAEYDEENEGKLVALYSDLWLIGAPTDPQTGLNVKCGILVKNVEMYQYYLDGDVVYKKYLGHSEKNIKGKHGENYRNVEFPKKYKTTAILGDVCVADSELLIGPDLLKTLVRTHYDSDVIPYQKLDPDIKIPGFTKDEEGNFTNGKGEKPEIGDIRISYHYLTLKSLGKVLVVGKQQGDEIVADGEKIATISTTAENLEQLKAELKDGDHTKAAKNLTIMAFVELLGAVIAFVVDKFRKKKLGGI